MGFLLVFMKWLEVFYENPTSIKLGGGLSQPFSFSLSRGTQQGCSLPLSLPLVAIAVEPVAKSLRISPKHFKGYMLVGWSRGWPYMQMTSYF